MISPDQLQNFQERVHELNILVIGDLMLDRYLWGQVSRISPEAPVPVVDVVKSEGRPGGAANVALNLAAMGASVSLAGVIGTDAEGDQLIELLGEKQFNTHSILRLSSRPTTSKTRIIAHNQQMMRVDKEKREPLEEADREALTELIFKQLPLFDAVIFEDYDKGVLDQHLVRKITESCRDLNIPVTVDPKFRNFFHFGDSTLFKPNLKELNEGLGLRIDRYDLEGLVEAVKSLKDRMPHAMTLITLSENGMLAVAEDGTWMHLPAHFRKITDVSGAGDTVVALITLGLAAGLDLSESAEVANLGGGLVCEEVGVVPISSQRLFDELKP